MQNKGTPEVSVLMITYNARKFIRAAIDSILNQSFKNFELLVYNDGSTDDTKEIVTSIKDERILLIDGEVNQGLFYARNIALKAARGKYIAILDSDDIALPHRLKVQYDFMEAHPDFALCGGNAKVINSEGDMEPRSLNDPLDERFLKAELFFNNIFVNSSTIFRKDIVIILGGYHDMAPVEDYELFVRIANLYPIYVFNEVFVYYRRHGNNISTKQQHIGDSRLKRIKEQQLSFLGIDAQRHGDAFYNLLQFKYENLEVKQCLDLLTELKGKNKNLKMFPEEHFEKRIFSMWYNFVMMKVGKRKAVPLLLNKELFSIRIVSWKQLRKIIKLSVKYWLRGLF